VGEGGIGKSRLVASLVQSVAKQRHAYFELRASPHFQTTAWFPVMDMLRRFFRLEDEATVEAKAQRLEQSLAVYDMVEPRVVAVLASLLLGVVPERFAVARLTAERLRSVTLDSVAQLIEKVSLDRPVLFIAEDLHWIDPTTLELLSELASRTNRFAICLVVTSRPGARAEARLDSVNEYRLNRLSKDDAATMVAEVLRARLVDDYVVSQILDKSDGVPLFIEELTKVVAEHEPRDGDNSGSMAIPATLQGSPMARLDRLSTAKHVAQIASVLGRHFGTRYCRLLPELTKCSYSTI
jgi:predicted ATPase